jgi:uncharacterized protein
MQASSWLIAIGRIPAVGLDLTLDLDEAWFARWRRQDPGLEIADPSAVSVRLRVEKHGRDLLLRGRLHGRLTLACSRCLTPFAAPAEAAFDLLLAPGPEPVHPGEEELTAEELDMDFYSGDTLDLEPILKEQVILLLPVKPLCAEDCKGLCPRCGANLNTEPCTCGEERSTPLLAPLTKLKP